MPHAPKLCRHKSTRQYYVTLGGRRHYLGRLLPAARTRYARLIAEWESADRSPLVGSTAAPTMAVLIDEYCRHVEEYYRRADGSQGSEVTNIAIASRPLMRLLGDLQVGQITALRIEAARDSCIDHSWMNAADLANHKKSRKPMGWCRSRINQNLGRWKRMFKWGFTRGFVPLEVREQVNAVEGLRVGRTRARESQEVLPVPAAVVDATMPHVLAPVRAMIELQRLTGMRPGEVCRLRPCDVDKTGDKVRMLLRGTPIELGDAWVYLPPAHKTAHRGHRRIVPIGPKAQAVLEPWLNREPEAYCFSPAEALAVVRIARRQRRRTPVQPSQRNRRLKRPRKQPSVQYSVAAYSHAIAKACKANGIPHWHPHQLRHARAHELEQQFGYETTSQVLGHRHVNTTKLYLAAAVEKGIRAMEKAG